MCRGSFQNMSWAQACWPRGEILKFESINQAAKALPSGHHFWIENSFSHHRRAELILGNLRALKPTKVKFPEMLQEKTVRGFCLLDENTLFFSQPIWPAVDKNGIEFELDTTLPSRAYLKLWEGFTLFPECRPVKTKCLEVGASPGGWTAVLRSLGNEVWAFDRSELSPALMKDPLVHFKKADAFSVEPKDWPQVTHVFSDVICYPEKLWEWAQKWMADRPAVTLVFTVKFQGQTDFKTLEKFKAVPNSRLVHLRANKHELTWIFGAVKRT